MSADRQTIAIDIDDVLAESAKGFVGFSNQRWGTSLEVDDYQEHWAEMWKVDNEEVEKRALEYHNSGVLSTFSHREAALSVLEALKENFNLIIITSRRLQMKNDTLAWVHMHYPGIFSNDDINFAGIWDIVDEHSHTKTKAELAMTLRADYIIDDQLKHCIAAGDYGIKAILFGNYRWNQTQTALTPHITRVTDWEGVLDYFRGR